MAELTPPPILNAIAEAPSGLTPRVWARWFDLLQQQVLAGGGGTEGPTGPTGATGSQGSQGIQGIQGPAGVPSYITDTFTMTGSGFSGTAPTGTATYVKIGQQVTLMVPALIGTSNATTFGVTGIPAALAPLSALQPPVSVTDNSAHQVGLLYLSGTTWGVYLASFAPFAATGTKQLNPSVVTYLVA